MKIREITKKWWFYPVLSAYLIFGIWFGSLNYKIGQFPNDYNYWTRFTLYPFSTVLADGWFCSSEFSKAQPPKLQCIVGSSSYESRTITPWEKDLKGNIYYKTSRIIALTFFWPVKIIVNVILIVIIYSITIVVTVCCALLFFFRFFLYHLVMLFVILIEGFVKIFNLLL